MDRLSGFRLHRLCSSYPTAVWTGKQEDAIVVEGYIVDESTLASLDRLEGHPNSRVFARQRVSGLRSGTLGWVYACSDPTESAFIASRKDTFILSGDWNDLST